MSRTSPWGIILVTAWSLALASGTTADEGKTKATAGLSLRGREFLKAFNDGDAKGVARFFTEDGTYVDPLGRTSTGRVAIEKLYSKVFAERKGAKLAIHVQTRREVTPDVMIEDGISEVTSPAGPPSVARFSAVMVKRDGEWYLERVQESPVVPPSNAEHLDDVAWLVGQWRGEAKGESMAASYAWAHGGNFLVSNFTATADGVPVVGGTQWIGWDAVDKRVRSWSFFSNGGFGEAVWTKDGNTWRIKTTAKTQDGRAVTVTNVVTKVSDDSVTWQQTGLTVDGKSMPDGPVRKLTRVKVQR